MSDWTSGYVADVGYTYGYYSELNPERLRLAFLYAGFAVPEVVSACELGFGQGISTNIHAAASTTRWSGTDFNPAQAAFANELSSVCNNEALLTDEAFEEFCTRQDLPDFDFIALHGIWSWISSQNRQVIVDFIKRKLKVGGVVYVSYNTLPGWSSFAPIRHLMTEHASRFGSSAEGIINRINGALDFGTELLDAQAKYAQKTPGIGERIDQLKNQDRHYLAHEYFNKDWHPMYFADVANWLEDAKLEFGCSANYLDAVDAINLSPDQIKFIAKIDDRMFKQTVRDFCTNQQFRRDYWVKGPRRLTALERLEQIREESIVLVVPKASVPEKVSGSYMEATLQKNIYSPIIDILQDNKPHNIGEIEHKLKEVPIKFEMLLQAVMVLVGSGSVAPARKKIGSETTKKVGNLNKHLMKLARSSNDMRYLASPLTAGGINVPRFQQLFMMAMSDGLKKPQDWAKYAWGILDMQGQKIVKNGANLQSSEENLLELQEQASEFQKTVLPILRALGIANS